MLLRRLRHMMVVGCCLLPITSFGLRCGTGLVETGDHWKTVVQKCGKPTTRLHVSNSGLGFEGPERLTAASTRIEGWLYDRSPTGFIYIVYFDELGYVQRIKVTR